MKYFFRSILGSLLIIYLLPACNKNVNSPKSKIDYSAGIINKLWWGTVRNDGFTDYFAMRLNADNSMNWIDWVGEHKGLWSIEGNRLTVSGSSYSEPFRAEITDSLQITKIEMLDSLDFIIKNVEMTTGTEITDFEGTFWSGAEDAYIAAPSLYFYFLPGIYALDMQSYFRSIPISMPYDLTLSGRIIHADDVNYNHHFIFGIRISDSVMVGSYRHGNVYSWKATLK